MIIIYHLTVCLIVGVNHIESKPVKPNILFILGDDLGYADVSWNNPEMITPHLHKLARQGVILDQFYAQPKCSPSRAALLTGIYPYKMSMQRGSIGDFRPTGVPTILPTLPQLLKRAGYSTHLVGKWHVGYCHEDYTPNKRGFDTFFGALSQQADHYTRIHEINRFIGAGYDLWRNGNISYEGKGKYSTHLWEEETISLINSMNSSSPWFIQLAPTAAHTPFQAPDQYSKLYVKQRKNKWNGTYDDEIVRKGMVTSLDESVGKIVDVLKSKGLYDNTVIVFSSDNGAGLHAGNAPLRGKKGEIFEGGVRVPAFIHGKVLRKYTKIQPGHVSSNMVHIVDWYPTLLSLAGLKNEDIGPVDGVDLWPLVTRDVSVRSTLVYNIDVDDQSETFQFGVRRGNYKIIWGQTKEFKQKKKKNREIYLFNLENDPSEKKDLSKKEPKKLLQMKELIKSLAKDLKIAFHPNGLNLGYPRYHKGLLEPGWCQVGWWEKIWKSKIKLNFLDKI